MLWVVEILHSLYKNISALLRLRHGIAWIRLELLNLLLEDMH